MSNDFRHASKVRKKRNKVGRGREYNDAVPGFVGSLRYENMDNLSFIDLKVRSILQF